MPKEKPLQGLSMLQWVRETKFTVFVINCVEVNQFGAGFENRIWRALVVIDENRDFP